MAGTIYFWLFSSSLGNSASVNSTNTPSGGGSSFIPLGTITRNSSSTPSFTATSSSSVSPTVSVKLPRLRPLSEVPIAGAIATSTKKGLFVRYIDRGLGHIYEAAATSTSNERIINITIPRIYEAQWLYDAGSFIARYMKQGDERPTAILGSIVNRYSNIYEVATSTATSTSTKKPTVTGILTIPELYSNYLSVDISDAVTAPSKKLAFYIVRKGTKSTGVILDTTTRKTTDIFELPLTELLGGWLDNDHVFITTKPTALGVGVAYSVAIKNGDMQKIIGPLRGLTVLGVQPHKNPNDQQVLVSYLTPNLNLTTALINIKTGAITDLPLRTFSEKCVWARAHQDILYCAVPKGQLGSTNQPDAWYQGKEHFNDSLWEYNTITGEVRLVADIYDLSNVAVDAIQLFTDPTDSYIFFTNKHDGILWALQVQE